MFLGSFRGKSVDADQEKVVSPYLTRRRAKSVEKTSVAEVTVGFDKSDAGGDRENTSEREVGLAAMITHSPKSRRSIHGKWLKQFKCNKKV